MKFYLEDLLVYFPFPYVYPEQYDYMLQLKRSFDANGPVCLECPTGSGKTVSLLSVIVSYQLAHPESTGKLVYCCRTVGEIGKTIEELRGVIAYRDSELGIDAPKTLALSLSARSNLCVHPEVSSKRGRHQVDALCRGMTASWQRELGREGGANLCDFYEGFEKEGREEEIYGIYSIQDLKEYGVKHGYCPYFLARKAVQSANIVVYSYQYMLNQRIASKVSRHIPDNSIIVFDEAHNIDDVCIEAFSIELDRRIVESSSRNIFQLQKAIKKTKAEDAQRLQEEYANLLAGLAPAAANGEEEGDGTADPPADPLLPADVIEEALPAEMRDADEYLGMVRKWVDYVRGRLQIQQLSSSDPNTFLQRVLDTTKLDPVALRFFRRRLNSLYSTLQITAIDQFMPLTTLCDFASLVSHYSKGFKIIIEPYDERTPNIPDPLLTFACLDASLAMSPVISKFKRVVITSGTLSPLTMIPKLLGFQPVISKSLTTTLTRQNVMPLVVSRGSDQTLLSTKFQERKDMDIIRNYGQLLLRLCENVPDGVVAFFVSYSYMESIVSVWNSMGLINQILKHKLVFVETADIKETSIALDNFRKACDCGRGGVFLSVARGKVSEGIDFNNHYGRAVVLFGIPYIYTESKILKARLEFLRENHRVREGDFLTFDAMRTAAQCLGRVIRGKGDYGIMVLADRRYARADKRTKLPQWIQQYMSPNELNLSTEGAVHISSKFLREMAQPIERDAQLGVSLWTQADVEAQATSRPHVRRRVATAEENILRT